MRKINENIQTALPPHVFMNWVEHECVSAREKETAAVAIEADKLWGKVLSIVEKMDTTVDMDERKLLKFRIVNLSKDSRGIRLFLTEFFKEVDYKFESIADLGFMILILENALRNREWLNDSLCADFMIFETHKNIGVAKAWEMILQVVEYGDPLTVNQWLWCVENFSVIEGTPVSWWIAMAQ